MNIITKMPYLYTRRICTSSNIYVVSYYMYIQNVYEFGLICGNFIVNIEKCVFIITRLTGTNVTLIIMREPNI